MTYPKKCVGQHSFSEDGTREVVFFTNRYLKYVIDNGTVRAACFDNLSSILHLRKQGALALT